MLLLLFLGVWEFRCKWSIKSELDSTGTLVSARPCTDLEGSGSRQRAVGLGSLGQSGPLVPTARHSAPVSSTWSVPFP